VVAAEAALGWGWLPSPGGLTPPGECLGGPLFAALFALENGWVFGLPMTVYFWFALAHSGCHRVERGRGFWTWLGLRLDLYVLASAATFALLSYGCP